MADGQGPEAGAQPLGDGDADAEDNGSDDTEPTGSTEQ
jgi:hypothetical protein